MKISTPVVVLLLLQQANAFLSSGTSFVPRVSPQSQLHSTSSSTADSIFGQIQGALGLQLTDFTSTYLGDSNEWLCEKTAVKGSAEWYSEASPKYLTGVSKTSQVSAQGSQYAINVWMGPSYDVPNMLLSFGASVDGVAFVVADYVPRGATPLGSDGQYMEAYFGPDVIGAWDSASSIDGAVSVPPDMSFESRLLYSPARIAIAGLTEADAANIAYEHVTRFLGWVANAQPIPARSRGSFNMRDDKLRQFFFRGEVKKNCASFGPELGMDVAAVNTGPVAEAYVGGGS